MESRSEFVHSVRGTRICRPAFAALAGRSKQTFARHAIEIVEFSAFRCYESNLSKPHLGITGTHGSSLMVS